MRTCAVFFPFDLFGSGGAGDGARLLADALREMLADNRREQLPTRARAYSGQVRIRELGFPTLGDYQDWRKRGRQAARTAFTNGDFLLWVTGNHLGTLPVYDELSGGKQGNALVVQFDAHLDVYNLSDCTSELSHGNFLLHCAETLPAIVNVGHRELLLRPEYVQQYYARAFAAADLAANPEMALAHLKDLADAAERVLVDIDCDVFDPAFFPGISHPLPFGLHPQFVLKCLEAIWSPKVMGISLSEFDPGRDRDERSLATLVWLMEYVLLKRYESA